METREEKKQKVLKQIYLEWINKITAKEILEKLNKYLIYWEKKSKKKNKQICSKKSEEKCLELKINDEHKISLKKKTWDKWIKLNSRNDKMCN